MNRTKPPPLVIDPPTIYKENYRFHTKDFCEVLQGNKWGIKEDKEM